MTTLAASAIRTPDLRSRCAHCRNKMALDVTPWVLNGSLYCDDCWPTESKTAHNHRTLRTRLHR
jgi:hypothetical protein